MNVSITDLILFVWVLLLILKVLDISHDLDTMKQRINTLEKQIIIERSNTK